MQPLEPDSPPGTPRPWLSGARTRVALAARPRCLVRPHGADRSLPPRQDRGGVSPCESPRVRGQFNDSQSVLNDWTALTRSRAILAGDLFLPYVKNSNLLAQDLASCLCGESLRGLVVPPRRMCPDQTSRLVSGPGHQFVGHLIEKTIVTQPPVKIPRPSPSALSDFGPRLRRIFDLGLWTVDCWKCPVPSQINPVPIAGPDRRSTDRRSPDRR